MSPSSRRALAAAAGLLSMGALAAGCGRDRGPGSASATTAASAASGVAAGSSAQGPPAGPFDPAGRQAIARLFAPRLRFNGWHDDGNGSRQNRHEDFFPMGVASFLRELHAGAARVLVQGSQRHHPGQSEVRPFAGSPAFGPDKLEPYPREMVGDPPGAAPLYVHVYDDPALRALAPDGSGQLEVWVEYWLFYPHDRAEVALFSFFPTWAGSSTDLIGHRADWEHVQFRSRVRLGPGGALLGGELVEGTYYGHGHGLSVDAADLECLDDRGAPDPQGTHPVVYVSQGKHASFPQAGHWSGAVFPTWVADYTDFFRGNGVVVDAWSVPLIDLEDPAGAPDELSSPEFLALAARSPAAAGLSDWTLWPGRWGPDEVRLTTPAGSFGTGSPRSPRVRGDYHDFGGRGAYPRWVDVKAREPGLVVYADRGIAIPDVVPPPLPVRR